MIECIHRLSRVAVGALIAALGYAGTATAEECPPGFIFSGADNARTLGRSVDGAGDVNADGYADLIVGAYDNAHGSAIVYSGHTGDAIYSFTGDHNYYGIAVAGAGDVNADGFDDFMIGASGLLNEPDSLYNDPQAGMIFVVSGKTGLTLFARSAGVAGDRYGFAVDGAGDVNADGHSDIIVGAWNSNNAYVYSGIDGSLLYNFTGAGYFGRSVAGVGDINADGYADVAVGARIAGNAFAYSGKDGSELFPLPGSEPVSGAGDVDGDGFDDIISSLYVYWIWALPRVFVTSGRTGDVLYEFVASDNNERLGSDVAIVGDVNGDGYDDFAIGVSTDSQGGLNAGRILLYSGLSGDVLQTFTGEAPDDQLGVQVSAAGDVNADGYPDLIAGSPHNDGAGPNYGRTYVFSGSGCLCGDSDGDMRVLLSDVLFLEAFYLGCGDRPFPYSTGDVSCDGIVDVWDIALLYSYVNGNDPSICCLPGLISKR